MKADGNEDIPSAMVQLIDVLCSAYTKWMEKTMQKVGESTSVTTVSYIVL